MEVQEEETQSVNLLSYLAIRDWWEDMRMNETVERAVRERET